jgi:hypothetical protein
MRVPEDDQFMTITEHDAARTSAMGMTTASSGVPKRRGAVQEARGVLGESSGIRP